MNHLKLISIVSLNVVIKSCAFKKRIPWAQVLVGFHKMRFFWIIFYHCIKSSVLACFSSHVSVFLEFSVPSGPDLAKSRRREGEPSESSKEPVCQKVASATVVEDDQAPGTSGSYTSSSSSQLPPVLNDIPILLPNMPPVSAPPADGARANSQMKSASTMANAGEKYT